eukprot:Nitzschia sp. Nitz4//scaffold1_size375055//16469//18154//NITZ4_000207-RA/size375055-augustus-gene-0.658-mRNA-1//1//CDS//3329540838//8290//frame0
MAAYSTGDNINAVVADIGAWSTKIGFAGEDYPRSYFRSNVAVLRDQAEESGKKRRRQPIDKVEYDSLHRRVPGEADAPWSMQNPVDPTTGLWYDPKGVTNEADWADLIPSFLRHGYNASLGLRDTSENPLLLVEKAYNPPPLRQQLLEILMEECQVPATFLGRDATLACYACGRTTSTVIDIGYNGTTVTPVFEGYVEQKGIRRAPIGTLAMDELALQHLQAICSSKKLELKPLYQVRKPDLATRPDAFRRFALLHIAKECRESGAGQSINTAASKTLHVPSISYTLPDGELVDVPSQNRFAVADLVVGVEEEPVTKMREEAVTNLKSKYSDLLSPPSDMEEDEGEDDNDNDDEEKKAQAEKYTEATAVGVSSRRTSRGRQAKSPAEKATTGSKTRVHFDNRVLQEACVPYLQAHFDQFSSVPIANMVCDAAFRCDRDQQASVLGNVILCGGGACIGPTDQAMPDLLRDQIESIVHAHTPGWRVKVLSPPMQERAICNWLGGSILASLGTFHEMWITKADYEEWGSAIVNRKCP